MKRSIVIALLLLPFAAAPARAQIPGLGEAGRLLDRVPSLSSFLEGDPPITTSLDDARTEIAFLDVWSPTAWEPLQGLPRTSDGAFRLRPGRFAMEAQSYCMHAGTHGPGGGDGYLYAPLAGPKAPIVRSILRNSVAHPEISQGDIQVLIWAIIARTEFDEMPSEMQRTARTLLTRDQVKDLDKGALGLVPESVMREAMSRLPPLAQQVFQAEARLRSMISSGTSNFADLERVAVLAGAVEPPEGSRPVPDGRWSFDPDGYFVRYDPSGYSRTRVEVSVPAPVAIARDGSGRIVGIYGRHGRRLEIDAAGVRLARHGGDAGETVLGAAPPPTGGGGTPAAAVLDHVLGSGRPPDRALRELGEIEALAGALRSAGVAVGDGASAPGGAAAGRTARAEALDLLAEAWQATFCLAAGCPTTPAGGDVLVLRNRATVRGDLRWCSSDICLLGSTPFDTEAIEWIGLARADASPPAAVHPDAGEVHRGDGSVRVGDLVALGDRFVLTDTGGHDRPEVAWIHLVPGLDEPPAGPPSGGAPDGGAEPEEEREDEEEDDEDEDDEDEDLVDEPLFDPSGDVATPGNRGRQRLAQSGRPVNGGDAADGEEDPCAGAHRSNEQAWALFKAHLQRMDDLWNRIENEMGIPVEQWEGYAGPGQNLIYEWEEMEMEMRGLLERAVDASFLLDDCRSS